MSDKHLQRVTEYVSDIGHGIFRRVLPPRRLHITQKVKITSQRTLHLASGHGHLKHCTSLPDLIGRHLLVESCGHHDLAQVPGAAKGDRQ